jgi:hypothetical protein
METGSAPRSGQTRSTMCCATQPVTTIANARGDSSRATLPKAIQAVEEVQAKVARHPQPAPAAGGSIATYQEELRTIAARLHVLADRLADHSAEHAPLRAQLTVVSG